MMNTQTQATKNATLNIGGMVCSGCANTVQEALNSIDGVEKAEVNLDDEVASVSYDASAVSIDDFQKAVDGEGYEFLGMEN